MQKSRFTPQKTDHTRRARQLPSGLWTSKLGEMEDIEHTLRGLKGDIYGAATGFLKRPANSV